MAAPSMKELVSVYLSFRLLSTDEKTLTDYYEELRDVSNILTIEVGLHAQCLGNAFFQQRNIMESRCGTEAFSELTSFDFDKIDDDSFHDDIIQKILTHFLQNKIKILLLMETVMNIVFKLLSKGYITTASNELDWLIEVMETKKLGDNEGTIKKFLKKTTVAEIMKDVRDEESTSKVVVEPKEKPTAVEQPVDQQPVAGEQESCQEDLLKAESQESTEVALPEAVSTDAVLGAYMTMRIYDLCPAARGEPKWREGVRYLTDHPHAILAIREARALNTERQKIEGLEQELEEQFVIGECATLKDVTNLKLKAFHQVIGSEISWERIIKIIEVLIKVMIHFLKRNIVGMAIAQVRWLIHAAEIIPATLSGDTLEKWITQQGGWVRHKITPMADNKAKKPVLSAPKIPVVQQRPPDQPQLVKIAPKVPVVQKRPPDQPQPAMPAPKIPVVQKRPPDQPQPAMPAPKLPVVQKRPPDQPQPAIPAIKIPIVQRKQSDQPQPAIPAIKIPIVKKRPPDQPQPAMPAPEIPVVQRKQPDQPQPAIPLQIKVLQKGKLGQPQAIFPAPLKPVVEQRQPSQPQAIIPAQQVIVIQSKQLGKTQTFTPGSIIPVAQNKQPEQPQANQSELPVVPPAAKKAKETKLPADEDKQSKVVGNCKKCGKDKVKKYGVILGSCDVCPDQKWCLVDGCGHEFQNIESLGRHVRNLHMRKKNSTTCLHCGYKKIDRQTVCPSCNASHCPNISCGFETRSINGLAIHMRSCQSGLIERTSK